MCLIDGRKNTKKKLSGQDISLKKVISVHKNEYTACIQTIYVLYSQVNV